MSSASRPTSSNRTPDAPRRVPVSLPQITEMHQAGQPIAMVTAYDYPSARSADMAGVDIVLVGDSVANCVLGLDSTVPVGMDEMLLFAKAVKRGAKHPFLVADLPFGSYEASDELAVRNSQRFVKEAGCDAVKLERGGSSAERARAIVRAGIPVMGHIGLTPQTATALGGMKAQGRTAERARMLVSEAMALERAGCFSIVIEAVPAAVSEIVCRSLSIPTIGIGAGPSTSGQVLVYHDLLGITEGHTAKFVKRFADIGAETRSGLERYVEEVRTGTFPAAEHIYSVEPTELAELNRLIEEDGLNSQSAWDWEPL